MLSFSSAGQRSVLGGSLSKTKKEKKGENKPSAEYIFENILSPKYGIMKEEDVAKMLAHFRITKQQLPKILYEDPVVKALGAKVGDVIHILRNEPTGQASYYRIVVK